MKFSHALLLLVFSCIYLGASGQMGVAYDLKKPARFENRTLASEKSNTGKKIKKARRFIQNTITHYNYYFNANEKLERVIALAKAQNRDDYTKLLAFYNYTLEATASQKKELDSVIYKCTAGILIHDTRNDWIDNLYLLIGKTYYLKKQFDSAYITLQFLNYAFAPKEEDGYDKPIGSNANADQGGSANIVSTAEKRDLLKKTFSLPPSRNDALVWKVRNYIAADQFPEAAGLIEILRRDPLFPTRLQPQLQEVRAWWFYKQSIYDSAAFYLERALPAAANREETARWEYLIAQLYEKVGKSFEAKTFYERTVNHTYNPILEVYARLNAIRQNKEGGEDYIARNIEALIRMGHKDRYESYRDIIYYTAAQMELERNNRPGAKALLLLSTRYSTSLVSLQRNRSFLQLANLSFEDKEYPAAKNFYDSLITIEPGSLGDISWLPDRKAGLSAIVAQLQVLARQDSLQRLAALPAAERDALVKKLAKALRRQQGLKEEDQGDGISNTGGNNNNAQITDLFNAGNSSNAEWYFYNQSLKARGYNDFKTKWGTRPNVDNWQVAAMVKQQASRNAERPITANKLGLDDGRPVAAAAPAGPISFKSLMDNLPLTPEKMKKSQDSVEKALFALGKAYQEGIADYPSAIHAYDSLLEKFSETPLKEQTLFNLYYCYKKIGDETNAARVLALLQQKFPGSLSTAKVTNPDSTVRAASSLEVNATHQYNKIYLSFIEGRFEEALADKKIADSLYGSKYWTPQLLYIESVYFIRTRQDNQAKVILSNIMSRFPRTPMAEKAANLLDVLSRRREIEDYLTRLQVTRVPDDSIVIAPIQAAPSNAPQRPRLVRNDSNMLVKEDTSQLARSKVGLPGVPKAGQKPSPTITGPDKLKIDTASMNKITMDAGQLARLRQQVDSLNAAMERAKADSAQTARLKHQSDSIQAAMTKLRNDTAQLAARVRSMNSVFSFTPDKPHAVLIVMDKVDPVYVSEARNAFNGYNTENFYSLSLTTNNNSLNDSLKLVVIGNFPTDAAALEYMQNIKALAPRQIVPWLPAGKYTFQIISVPNLELLLSNKDMPAYRRFLTTAYPGKF